METKWKTVGSLEKIFFHNFDDVKEQTAGNMMKNEIFSFQLVGSMGVDHYWEREHGVKFKFEIESELLPYIKVYNIGYVPTDLPTIEVDDDDDYITKEPGFFPDPLTLNKDGVIKIPNKQTRAVWITVEPQGKTSGIYPINIKVFDDENNECSNLTYTIKIIDASLPKMKLLNTCWFYGDCLGALHNVEIGSLEYYKIFEKYLEIYVKFGHNMILTPIFTPPLNTKVGGERPTNQLVGVRVTPNGYEFDFSKLDSFIDMCHRYGVNKFEISHLFTQWGAKFAPKIIAEKDGRLEKIFGWDTDGVGEEYAEFLDAFLPKLVEYLKNKGIFEDCLFHISDEPHLDYLERYEKARALVVKHLPEERLMDALGFFEYYEKGLVKRPVVSTNHIQKFMDNDVNPLWAYYCMSQREDVANRFFSMPAYRNRILGFQLYKYNIEGFLHWGYNFWFNSDSQVVLDPYKDTSAGGDYPGGDSFMVYPLNEDGEVVCSTRLYVFNETIQDLRALELLESLTDRETVMKLLDEIDGFRKYPRNNDYIINLRTRVNDMIEKKLKA